MNNEPANQLLLGDGEMGELIATKDWGKTPLGNIKYWPQSLRTVASVMVNNPFAMYIAWGRDYIQLYNDGFRPILGSVKHPSALGISTRETFSEVWHIIGPMFDEVMTGKAVSYPDFMLSLNRNGFVEECYFDFSYSPIREEGGEVGGVLVTVVETTDRKKGQAALQESKEQLEFAIEAAELGTWDYNPVSNKFSANERLIKWFGFPQAAELDLPIALNAIADTDRQRIADDIQTVLQFSSGGCFDSEFTIINYATQKEIIVRGIGKAWFTNDGIVYRFTGTLHNITEQVITRKKIEQSEEKLQIALEGGELGTFDFYPETDTLIWSEKTKELFGLPTDAPVSYSTYIQAIHPEDRNTSKAIAQQQIDLTDRGLYELEYRVVGITDGKLRWLRSKGKVTYNTQGNPVRYTGVIHDITKGKLAEEDIKESEQRLRSLVASVPFPIGVYTGKEMRIILVNDAILKTWDKTWDVLGKTYAEVLPELTGHGIYEQLDMVYTTGIPFHAKNQQIELMVGGKLQSYYFNYSFTPLFDAAGNVYGVMNTAADVTDLNIATKKTEESEKRFRNTVEQAPLGITIFRGPEFTVEMANDTYLKLVDRPKSDFIGKSLFDSLPEVKEIVKPLLTRVVTTGEPFYAAEFPINLNRYGKVKELSYFNLVYYPLREQDDEITGVIVVATEVTSLVKAKHSLAESEKQFRNLVMESPIAMTIFRGQDHIIEVANKVMVNKLWRKQENEVIGKKVLDVFPELKGQKYPELLQKVYHSGITHNENESLAFVDGDDGMKKFWLDYEYHPLRDTDGAISGIMITVNDVTEKVETRKRVEENEQRIRLAIEAANLGTFDWNLLTNEFTNSQRLSDIFGFLGQSSITHNNLLDAFHPDDKNIRNAAVEKAAEKGSLSYEARIIWQDKSVHWIRVFGKIIFNEEKKPLKMYGTVMDITEEKTTLTALEENRARLNIAIETAELGTWELNMHSHDLIYSGRYLEIMGFTKDDHPTRQELLNKIFAEDVDTWENAIKTSPKKGVLDLEIRINPDHKNIRWIKARGKTVYDQNNIPEKMIGIILDITESKKALTILQESEKELEIKVAERTAELEKVNEALGKSNSELEQFAYVASHDLQEPLRKIGFFTERLESSMENANDTAKDYYQKIQKATVRMNSLIRDLLDFSRLSKNNETFVKTDLNKILANIKTDFELLIEEKKAVIEQVNLPVIEAVPLQMQQLFYNLLSNSLKFSKKDVPLLIQISCKTLSAAEVHYYNLTEDVQYYLITIKDNGIGFEQEYAEQIFVIFQRLNDLYTYGGTGIGLALCRKIAMNHNGKIFAEATENEGSSFHIILPDLHQN